MPKANLIHLTELKCIHTDNYVGYDNYRLESRLDNGPWTKFHEGSLNTGLHTPLNYELIFIDKAEVRLINEDMITSDDDLGTVIINPKHAWSMLIFETFSAKYELKFSIAPHLDKELTIAKDISRDQRKLTHEEVMARREPSDAELDSLAMSKLPELMANGAHAVLTDVLTTKARMMAGEEGLEPLLGGDLAALVELLNPLKGIIAEYRKKQYGTFLMGGEIDVSQIAGEVIGVSYGIAFSIDFSECRWIIEVGAGIGFHAGVSGGLWFGFNRNRPVDVGGTTVDYVVGFNRGPLSGVTSVSFDLNIDFNMPTFNLQEVCYGIKTGGLLERSVGVAYCYVGSKDNITNGFQMIDVG
ncbi:hypothetical protein PE36_20490 [Moritella sp. PE36]|uniref:hypothetical protein n=1 Tax=Moritella sp. PE36 TaxID=58051 RepID=UPI00015689E4|nr:hypothetical protein [Moritella sp. PE36]EDM69021.1 hypothetical protein PE36_20490 [Moritella sp. PE36]